MTAIHHLTAAQRKVLDNLDRTAFYGQNQRTFAALERKGLIHMTSEKSPAGHHFHPSTSTLASWSRPDER